LHTATENRSVYWDYTLDHSDTSDTVRTNDVWFANDGASFMYVIYVIYAARFRVC
jgi:hypothetical protein